MLVVGSVFVALLASVSHRLPDGGHIICINMMEARGFSSYSAAADTQHCCGDELSNVLPRGKSESNPAPFGDPDDCSCCITMSYSMILGMIRQSGESHLEKTIHTIEAAVQTPANAGWRDPLLRPPIC
jgi:hypothetical protein